MLCTLDQVIAELDLEPIQLRLRKKQEWDPVRIETAIDEYRDFLQRRRDDPAINSRPLSKDMDEVWHAHILHTKKYAEDCQSIFGEFLHHTPHASQEDCCECACA